MSTNVEKLQKKLEQIGCDPEVLRDSRDLHAEIADELATALAADREGRQEPLHSREIIIEAIAFDKRWACLPCIEGAMLRDQPGFHQTSYRCSRCLAYVCRTHQGKHRKECTPPQQEGKP